MKIVYSSLDSSFFEKAEFVLHKKCSVRRGHLNLAYFNSNIFIS